MPTKLPPAFYQQDDVVSIARQLLGKRLCTYIDGQITAGMIVETEAYRAPEDPASHAHNYRRTHRNEAMYLQGGMSYVYLIYGIYKLFNVVTNSQDIPHAVLIRAIEPLEGITTMLQRRQLPKIQTRLSAGPGVLGQALGIDLSHSGIDLQGNTIWISPYQEIEADHIVASPRIGLGKSVTEPYFSMPWRFHIKDNCWVSK